MEENRRRTRLRGRTQKTNSCHWAANWRASPIVANITGANDIKEMQQRPTRYVLADRSVRKWHGTHKNFQVNHDTECQEDRYIEEEDDENIKPIRRTKRRMAKYLQEELRKIPHIIPHHNVPLQCIEIPIFPFNYFY